MTALQGRPNRTPTPPVELSERELLTFAEIERRADMGLPAPTCDELQEILGCNALSTTVYSIQKLEAKRLIQVDRYQRTRRITILATGKATATVSQAPHWRNRPRPQSIPTVALPYVQARKSDLAREIMVAARHEGLSLQDMLLELIWAGWQAREASIQAGQVEEQGVSS